MLIIGCDLHTRHQVIAMLNATTGEVVTRRLGHENREARAFYCSLSERARVGIWASRLRARPAIRRSSGRNAASFSTAEDIVD